jgi:hypothetical protein
VAPNMRFHSTAVSLTILGPLLGCSAGGPQLPTVTFNSGPVVVPVTAPSQQQATGQPMPGGMIGPPPGMEPPAPSAPRPAGRSGTYAGVMEPFSTAGGDINCMNSIKVTGWHVYGNRVRFGGFHGTIDAAEGLQMAFGGDWIVGQFEGPTFQGQVISSGGRFGPGCSFTLSLQRVGQ